MQETLNLYKPLGWTPLEVIEAYRKQHPEYADVKMTYAGRLDPMAEGVLLVLAGDAVHKKDAYLALDKQYEAEFLLGFETDSYDVLGLIEKSSSNVPSDGLLDELYRFQGANLLELPAYSSYVVNGQPLFYWAREGKLDELQLPRRTMTVHDLHIQEIRLIQTAELLAQNYDRIQNVHGDFRQNEIKRSWRKTLEGHNTHHSIIAFNTHVSSGTYIRSIAHTFGQRVGCGAIVYALKRTAVGDFNISDSISVD